LVFRAAFNAFTEKFGGLTWGKAQFGKDSHGLLQFLLEMSSRTSAKGRPEVKGMRTLQDKYLSHFPGDQRPYAEEILDLARASYRFRDDDNYLSE